jgi:hypothetical protein
MKTLTSDYTFDKTAKTVTFTGTKKPTLIEQMLLVTNVTNNTIVYNFADPSLGGTLSGSILTLNYDTSAMNNTDKLQIFYDSLDTNVGIISGSNLIGKISIDQVTANANEIVVKSALPSGTNVIGKTGYKLVKVSTSFNRPADTTTYAVGDAMTNSTSGAAVFELDLGAAGAVNGQTVEIRKLSVVSSVKQALLPLLNVYLSDATFTATNDNSALAIDDATMEADGAWFNCDIQNYTANNARSSYVSPPVPIVLAAADSKLYGTIQTANAYIPTSSEKFTIIAWVALL